MKLKIAEPLWTALTQSLLARTDVESAGLLFGESLPTATGTAVVR